MNSETESVVDKEIENPIISKSTETTTKAPFYKRFLAWWWPATKKARFLRMLLLLLILALICLIINGIIVLVKLMSLKNLKIRSLDRVSVADLHSKAGSLFVQGSFHPGASASADIQEIKTKIYVPSISEEKHVFSIDNNNTISIVEGRVPLKMNSNLIFNTEHSIFAFIEWMSNSKERNIVAETTAKISTNDFWIPLSLQQSVSNPFNLQDFFPQVKSEKPYIKLLSMFITELNSIAQISMKFEVEREHFPSWLSFSIPPMDFEVEFSSADSISGISSNNIAHVSTEFYEFNPHTSIQLPLVVVIRIDRMHQFHFFTFVESILHHGFKEHEVILKKHSKLNQSCFLQNWFGSHLISYEKIKKFVHIPNYSEFSFSSIKLDRIKLYEDNNSQVKASFNALFHRNTFPSWLSISLPNIRFYTKFFSSESDQENAANNDSPIAMISLKEIEIPAKGNELNTVPIEMEFEQNNPKAIHRLLDIFLRGSAELSDKISFSFMKYCSKDDSCFWSSLIQKFKVHMPTLLSVIPSNSDKIVDSASLYESTRLVSVEKELVEPNSFSTNFITQDFLNPNFWDDINISTLKLGLFFGNESGVSLQLANVTMNVVENRTLKSNLIWNKSNVLNVVDQLFSKDDNSNEYIFVGGLSEQQLQLSGFNRMFRTFRMNLFSRKLINEFLEACLDDILNSIFKIHFHDIMLTGNPSAKILINLSQDILFKTIGKISFAKFNQLMNFKISGDGRDIVHLSMALNPDSMIENILSICINLQALNSDDIYSSLESTQSLIGSLNTLFSYSNLSVIPVVENSFGNIFSDIAVIVGKKLQVQKLLSNFNYQNINSEISDYNENLKTEFRANFSLSTKLSAEFSWESFIYPFESVEKVNFGHLKVINGLLNLSSGSKQTLSISGVVFLSLVEKFKQDAFLHTIFNLSKDFDLESILSSFEISRLIYEKYYLKMKSIYTVSINEFNFPSFQLSIASSDSHSKADSTIFSFSYRSDRTKNLYLASFVNSSLIKVVSIKTDPLHLIGSINIDSVSAEIQDKIQSHIFVINPIFLLSMYQSIKRGTNVFKHNAFFASEDTSTSSFLFCLFANIQLASVIGKREFLANNALFDAMLATGNVQFDSLINLNGLFGKDGNGIDFDKIPEKAANFTTGFLKIYFDGKEPVLLMPILEALAELNPTASANEIMAKAMLAAGPALQKMVQFISDRVQDKAVAHILSSMKSSIPPMAPSDLDELIIRAFGSQEKFHELIPEFQSKSISAASIGQGHLCKFIHKGKIVDAFIKIKKPGLAEKFQAELRIMERVSEIVPDSKFYLREFQSSTEHELDWSREFKNIATAYTYYNTPQFKNIRAVKPFAAFPENNPDFIVMERAEGVTVSSFIEDLMHKKNEAGQYIVLQIQIETLVRLLEESYQLWIGEALFGSGFFHGDLHSGNMLFFYNKSNPELSYITLIDLGNAAVLDNNIFLEKVMLIGFGVMAKNTNLILDGLGRKNATKEQREEMEKIRKELDEFYLTEAASKLEIEELIDRSMQIVGNYPNLPDIKPLVNFFRSKVLLENTFNSLKKSIEKRKDLVNCKVPIRPFKLAVSQSIARHPLDAKTISLLNGEGLNIGGLLNTLARGSWDGRLKKSMIKGLPIVGSAVKDSFTNASKKAGKSIKNGVTRAWKSFVSTISSLLNSKTKTSTPPTPQSSS